MAASSDYAMDISVNAAKYRGLMLGFDLFRIGFDVLDTN